MHARWQPQCHYSPKPSDYQEGGYEGVALTTAEQVLRRFEPLGGCLIGRPSEVSANV